MSTEKVDIKETIELLETLGRLGIVGKKIAKNGIGVDDLVHLVDLARESEKILSGFKGIKQIPTELKDLDEVEVLEIIGAIYKQADMINKA